MIEMRDGKSTINEKEMDLDFMFSKCWSLNIRYAVPKEIKELEKKPKPKGVDEEAAKFLEKYVNRNPIVTEMPEEADAGDESKKDTKDDDVDEYGNPKDPQKGVFPSR